MIGILKKVFSYPRSWVILFLVGAIIFVLATTLPNIKLIKEVFVSGQVTEIEKAVFLLKLSFSSHSGMMTFAFVATILFSLLFGFNTSLLSYALRAKKKISNSGTLFGGIVSGFLGAGCGACGTLVVAPILFAVGVDGVLAVLPLGGQEFILLGVILLIFSSFVLLRRLSSPLLCLTE